MSDVKLKPCPFCPDGGKPYYVESVNGSQMAYVGCSVCGISMKAALVSAAPTVFKWSKDLVSLWNSRNEAENKRLREALEHYAKKENWQCRRCKGSDELNCHLCVYVGPILSHEQSDEPHNQPRGIANAALSADAALAPLPDGPKKVRSSWWG